MKRSIYVFLLGVLFVPAAAHADMIQGRISAVDAVNNIVSLTRIDNYTGSSRQVNVQLNTSTQSANVPSVDALKPGQLVKVDAKEDRITGVWQARSVERTVPYDHKPGETEPY